MAQDQARTGEAVRITTAAASRLDDIRSRQRRYLASMSLRTICFVGAVIVRDGVFMWILIAGAILLPYVAVVMANAVTTRPDGFALRDGALSGRQLPTAPTTRRL